GVHLDEVDRIAEPGEVLNIPLGEWKGGRGGEPAPVRPVKIHEWGEGLVFDRNHAPTFSLHVRLCIIYAVVSDGSRNSGAAQPVKGAFSDQRNRRRRR